jgi:hypothetical protein
MPTPGIRGFLARPTWGLPAGPLWRFSQPAPLRPNGAWLTTSLPHSELLRSPLPPLLNDLASRPLRPPRHRRAEHLAAPMVTGVWGREEHPPEATPLVARVPLTTLPVEDLAPAATGVRSSTYRWRMNALLSS